MIGDLLACVALANRVSVAEILGPSQQRRLMPARRLIAGTLRRRGMSLNEIKRVLHRRDHTTVLNLLKRKGKPC